MPSDHTVCADHPVSLRPHVHEDADQLAVLLNDPDVTEMTSTIPYPYARSDAEAFLSSACYDDGNTIRRAIDWRGMLVGSIGLGPRPGGTEEIGYWIGKPYWGKGIASAALEAFLKELAAKGVGGPIHAQTVASNEASQHVLLKNGFAYVGEGQCITPARQTEKKPSKRYVLKVLMADEAAP
jgi:RimJ/RimL family protein N-acetyltransferase